MVVDEIAMIPPSNKLSILDHPKSCPEINPMTSIMVTSKSPVIAAVLPTFTNFLKLNSKPKLNSKKITPISAHISMVLISVMDGKIAKFGPTSKPARI